MYTQQITKKIYRGQVHLLDRYLLQRETLEETLQVEFQGSWDRINSTKE